MKAFNHFASAATIAVAAFATSSAFADCAEELSSLKQEMGVSSSSMSNTTPSASDMSQNASDTEPSQQDGSMSAGASSDGMAAGKTPAATDKAAVADSDGKTFTQSGSEQMSAKGDATGALSGVAPTAALGENAKAGASSAGSGEESSSKSDMSADAAGSESSMGSSQEATGKVGGVEATKEMGDVAASSGASSSSDDGTTASTTGDASSTANVGSMAQSHLAAAQMALDSGDEEACMAAVKTARSSM